MAKLSSSTKKSRKMQKRTGGRFSAGKKSHNDNDAVEAKVTHVHGNPTTPSSAAKKLKTTTSTTTRDEFDFENENDYDNPTQKTTTLTADDAEIDVLVIDEKDVEVLVDNVEVVVVNNIVDNVEVVVDPPKKLPPTTTTEPQQPQGTTATTTTTTPSTTTEATSTTTTEETAIPKADPRFWADIESMPIITKSPYEQNATAEVDEPMFDHLKGLLVPQPLVNHDKNNNNDETNNNNFNKQAASPEAAELFGHRLASSMVAANYHVGKSGMLFSPVWQEGKIRGIQCGWIPKALLLLCLHEQRFARANEAVLQGIIKDLGLSKILGDALKEWQWQDDYMNLSSSLPNISFSRSRKDCMRCQIFVARAYRSVKALKKDPNTAIGESLMVKIKYCLQLMNDHVKVNKRELARRVAELQEEKEEKEKLRQQQQVMMKQEEEKQPRVAAASKPKRTTTTSRSKTSKREQASAASKRPRPQSVVVEASAPAAAFAAVDNTVNGGDDNNKHRKRRRRQESLTVLLGAFEKQYKRMGETLAVLRRNIQQHEGQTAHEIREEIRRELLQELQGEQNGHA